MKGMFIYVSAVGITAGIGYWLYKKGSFNNKANESADNTEDFDTDPQEISNVPNSDVMEGMYQTKSKSVQAVYGRHTEAGQIMESAYTSVMEDFVVDFSDEKDTSDINKKVIIDSESFSVMKEIDSISDELDDLLK